MTTEGLGPPGAQRLDELQPGRALAEVVVDDQRLRHAGSVDRGARGGNRRRGDDDGALIDELLSHRRRAMRIVVDDENAPAVQGFVSNVRRRSGRGPALASRSQSVKTLPLPGASAA